MKSIFTLCATAWLALATSGSAADFQAAYQQADGAIVILRTSDSNNEKEPPALLPTPRKTGVAFAVAKDKVVVALENQDKSKVEFELLGGDRQEGDVLVIDEVTGLAVVHLPDSGLNPLELADEPSAPGTPVIVPHRDMDQSLILETSTLTSGLVSQFPRFGRVQRISPVHSDASLRGAPVLNQAGQVVGVYGLQAPISVAVNVAQFTPFKPSTALCIPANVVQRMIITAEELNGESDKKPKRLAAGVIGLQLAGESEAMVQQILPDTPAAEADVQVGDNVEAVDGVDCRSHRQVVALVRSHRSGDTVPVRLSRNGKTIEVELKLQSVELPKNIAVFPTNTHDAQPNLLFFKDGQLLKIPEMNLPAMGPNGDWDWIEDPQQFIVPQPKLESLKIERSTLEESLRQLEKSRRTQDELMKKLKAEIERLQREKSVSLPALPGKRESADDLRRQLNEIIRDANRLLRAQQQREPRENESVED